MRLQACCVVGPDNAKSLNTRLVHGAGVQAEAQQASACTHARQQHASQAWLVLISLDAQVSFA